MTPTPTLIAEYDDAAPDSSETETATFALGCFWGPDAQFGALEGVVRTRVGYAGGTTTDPTYHALGDHTEAVQVDYDPAERSYADLLDRAFRSHDPHGQPRKTQYQNIVFAATDDQREAIDASLDERGFTREGIETRIEPLSRFYPAEDYHQKHALRNRGPIADPFGEAGYDDEAIRESPAAAKLNGYAAGHDVAAAEELAVEGTQTTRGR